jgi:hypothetical protein
MTSTVIARTTEASGLPTIVHAAAVIAAVIRANQNSQPAALSARRWAREDEFCASVTRRWMPARAVSSPVGGDLDPKPGIGGDGAGCDGIPDAAGNGPGFAGHHGLVHVGASVDDLAVGRDAAAGSDYNDIADVQVGRRDGDGAVAVDLLGFVGK